MRRLLQALWRGEPPRGAITFWLTPSKLSYHLPIRRALSLSDEDVVELEERAEGSNVYFGLGARVEGLDEKVQGGKKDVVALPAVALDVDFRDDRAHAAKNLPSDMDEAACLLDGLPDPSAVVHTGNGAHFYWFFVEPLLLDGSTRRTQAQKIFKAFQQPIIRAAAERGWHLDSTASIQRVWRVPGFVNRKTEKLVELVHCNAEARYDLENLGMKMPSRRGAQVESPPPALVADDRLLGDVRAALSRLKPGNRFEDSITAVLEGSSMAPPGRRDEALQGVCSTIAWLSCARGKSAEKLAEVLRPSLSVWAEEEGASKSLDDEMAKAVDKIARSQQDRLDKRNQSQRELGDLVASMKHKGVERDRSDEGEFSIKHSVIQYRSTYWLFDFRVGEYSVARTEKEIVPFARDAWEDGPEDLSIYYVNDKGTTKIKTQGQVCEEYCTVVDDVIGDMTIQESRLESGGRVFREVMARRRVEQARFDPEIDEWLHMLAGDRYDKMCDWLAAVTQLEYQSCALYLGGKTGAGKGMLAHGLARLWRKGGPTPFVNVIGDYNDELTECPLVWIDEGVPGRKGDITAELRAIVGRSSFSCSEKWVVTRPVVGAIRLLICANNDDVLRFGRSDITAADLDAIIGRILYIKARPEAAEWLQKRNEGLRLTRAWVEGDLLARHCLYLRENRELIPGTRFLVEGDESSMHRKLVMQGDVDGLVYEWLARFATRPQLVEKSYRAKSEHPLALIGGDEIMVNTQCVIDCWKIYMPEDVLRPSTTKIGRVLSRLAYRTARFGPRNMRSRYHVVRANMVIEWCQEHQIGNEDLIAENAGKPPIEE